jgi:hypothetical protein
MVTERLVGRPERVHMKKHKAKKTYVAPKATVVELRVEERLMGWVGNKKAVGNCHYV